MATAKAKAVTIEEANEQKVKDFFSNKKGKEEAAKAKQWFKDFPIKLLVFVYNAGLFVITSAIVVFAFILCIGLDTVLPPMLLGTMGYDLVSASAVNTMAMLSITILMSGALLMLMFVFTKTMFKKVFNKYKLVTERNPENGKLSVIKNNK